MLRQDSLRERAQRRLDHLRHGASWGTSHDVGGSRRLYHDGFERRFEAAPPAPRFRCPQCGNDSSVKAETVCWHCAGENRLTNRQRLYMRSVREEQDRSGDLTPAHCDGNVLHAPGKCWACDLPAYKVAHDLREVLAIAHSDEPVPKGWQACPSTAWRKAEKINRWGGNRADPTR